MAEDSRKMNFTHSRIFSADLNSLEGINTFIQQMCSEAGLNETKSYSVLLSTSEACSNIIEHAYRSEESGVILCTCQATPSQLKVILHDKGAAFDPSSVIPPDTSTNLENRRKGGLGVFFIRELMDEVSYHVTDSEQAHASGEDEGNYLILSISRDTKNE